MHFATLVSSLAKLWLKGAESLWITTRERALAFLVALTLAIGVLAAFETTGAFEALKLSKPLRPFPEWQAPEWVYIPWKIARSFQEEADIVLLLGGSTSRELTPSDDYVSSELSNRCGRAIRFINGGSSDQTLAEAWAITEAMPKGRLASVVVGVNYLRFEESMEDVARRANSSRMPFGIPAEVRHLLSENGINVGYSFPPLRWTGWLVNNLTKLTWGHTSAESIDSGIYTDPFEGYSNRYHYPPKPIEAKVRIVDQMISERLSLLESNHSDGGYMWSSFANLMTNGGSNVLFLVLPESSSLIPFRKRSEKYLQKTLGELESSRGRVLDWRIRPELNEQDFFDQQHLLRSGREKLSGELLKLFSETIPNCGR
ncbi:hypothetical protein EET67_06735 [Pseudaminobacter arsenicus]|uniref:Uncharacterized protein n=1 Tax=Borborobacter arsenicus TaxID=1851146 RepID=A0A432V866_9HYPH|nr:hypothetical protein [Pseudaminobacter arsenicus]RUM98330.1 hypothetical protein EET67_06735 [Pseudaminobacter arsenicus]